jgi:acetyl esterase/lipase
VLYLHGGAYCIGSPVTHRAITSRLALRAPARVFALDYRLAPEHPFPAAVDDACTAYSGLVASGVRPERIVIAGDSAGGGLAVAAAMRLRLLRQPLPAALYLICPWANLHGGHSPAVQGNVPCDEFERDWISRDWLDECANFYLAGHDAADPLASPVHGDTSGLPPTLIQAGEDELLLGDARQLHASMRAAGIATTLTVHPRRWHVFQVHGGMLRDADRALDEAAAFMRDRAGG